MIAIDKILSRSDVCAFLQELALHDRFKNIEIPQRFIKNVFLVNNYALLIALDAIIKYQIIIEDEIYFKSYLEQIRRMLKKFTTSQDLTTAINTIIGKITMQKLGLTNTHNKENKDKILRYIYDKYIINGYFYYGFSSGYQNEIEFIGIRKDGLIIDNKIKYINSILYQYNLDYFFKEERVNISDNFIVSAYHAFLAPIYLEKFLKNKLFTNTKYDKTAMYTKDIEDIKNILVQIASDNKFNEQDKVGFINTFLDILQEDEVNTSNPEIALIKRKAIKKNYLKDIELILKNCNELSLASSISLLIESRYESYELDEDIFKIEVDIIKLPTYKEIQKGNEGYIELDIEKKEVKISNLKEIYKEEKQESITYVPQNSYGAATIAVLGLILIAVGSILSVILKLYG